MDNNELLDKLSISMINNGYAITTRESYIRHVMNFIKLHVNIKDTSNDDLKIYIDKVADSGVSSSNLNQIKNALAYLMVKVLGKDCTLDKMRFKKDKVVRSYLNDDDIANLFSNLKGRNLILSKFIYGTGMHLMEVLRLRVCDIHFLSMEIMVRRLDGTIERVVPLPGFIVHDLIVLKEGVKDTLRENSVPLSHIGDQYIFGSKKITSNPVQLDQPPVSTIQKALYLAKRRSGIKGKVGCTVLRYSFGLSCAKNHVPLSILHQIMGHGSISDTQVYYDEVNRSFDFQSPLDRMRSPAS